jgi:LysM repeat protein
VERYREVTQRAENALEGYVRAVRSIAGLVIVALAGSAAFVAGPAASSRTVRVRPGDTLSVIATRAGTTVGALVAANGIRNPNQVASGSLLKLPPAGAKPPPITGFANGGRGLPLLLVAHPDRLALRPRFVHWAKTYGVPPDLFQALTWWESGWQNTVVSSTRAVGIGQLMPDTVIFVNVVLLGGTHLNPRKPDDNIRMSARFLRALLDATGGKADVAVAAYYQGLASVRAGRVLDETKHYVAGIVAFRSHFK